MFNPFFTTKSAGEDKSLGLSISHDIVVEQHGGLIEVETEPGEFTEIRVMLPRVAALLPERSWSPLMSVWAFRGHGLLRRTCAFDPKRNSDLIRT